MKPATLEFVRQRFAEYYGKAPLITPPSIEQREWGFVLFSPGYPEIHMRRHIGFPGKDDAIAYIRNLVPAHVYYSSAYYERPDAGSMKEKGWCGADLIFDLDADHIMRGPYDKMLARVKEETEKLLTMLTDEFGIDRRAIEVVFSGGRGYHIHVRDIAFRSWGSAERRELIDYVCGIGIDPAAMLSGKATAGAGWQTRYRATLVEYLQWIETLPEKEALAHLSAVPGIGKSTAEKIRNNCRAIIRDISSAPDPRLFKKYPGLTEIVLAEEGEFKRRLRERAALADEPVTTDTKRLIRMPSSLHGGSGMRVMPIEARDFASFDPLTDAVIFGTRDVRVDVTLPRPTPMLGSTYQLAKGITTVPEAVAVFLCCRGMAEIA
ncbi:MAG: DNA primase small subunit PriS [Methanoregula sp. PtaU1.Bin051]|nr:MAG: DNA primase small subunit PriS [Methanoregula sp. PtaU1.Bin051]